MNFARVFPVFSIAFAILYVLSMDNNWALFTYWPRSRDWYWLVATPPPRGGPGMYWYGWLATSALGAAAAAAIAYVVPQRWTARLWPGLIWAVPAGAILVLIFILRGWFIKLG